MFLPNFEILGRVVSEKSLTEKKFTHTHRHTHTHTKTHTQIIIVTEKNKAIYPLYTLYAKGINTSPVSSGWGRYVIKCHTEA